MLKVATVNLDSATAGPVHARRQLRKAARQANRRDVHVLAIVEANKVNVRKVLGKRWEVVQSWPHYNSPRSGCALAVRRGKVDIRSWQLRKGCGTFWRGRRAKMMRERWFIDAKLRIGNGADAWTANVAVVHLPPSRNWFLNPLYLGRVARCNPDMVFGDWNMRGRRVRGSLGMTTRFAGTILGGASARWIPTGPASKVGIGGDHPIIINRFWPTRRKR